jgi:hypothetical protein
MRKHYSKSLLRGVLFGLLLLAGCQNGQQQRLPDKVGDPLLGSDGLTIPKKDMAQGNTTPAQSPLPLTRQTSSTAEMASGGATMGGRAAIAIPVSQDGLSRNGWQIGSDAKPVLKQPIPDGSSAQSVPIVPISSPPAISSSTTDQLEAQLKAKGVVFSRHEPVPEGIKLICIVPNPQNPDALRTYQVTARDSESAMRAILEKLDQAH